MAFADVEALAAYAGKPLDNPAQAQLALDLATAIVQGEVGQTLAFVADDVVPLRGGTSDRLYLPERPVLHVASVVGKDVRDDDWEWHGDFLLRRGGWPTIVTVTYSHGHHSIPGDIKAVTLALAARLIASQNPEAAISAESVGTYRVDYARSSEGGKQTLLPAERDLLRRRYGRSAGMVALR